MVAVKSYVPEDGDPRTAKVLSAMSSYDLTSSSAWNELDVLATRVSIDDVEVDPAGILFDDAGEFRGSVNIYVVLRYGPDGDDGLETTESFRGRFHGRVSDDGIAEIADVTVDTSPFFEGESAESRASADETD